MSVTGEYKSPGIAAMVAEGAAARKPMGGGIEVKASNAGPERDLEMRIKEAADGTFTMHWYGPDGDKTASARTWAEVSKKCKAFFGVDAGGSAKEPDDSAEESDAEDATEPGEE